jgi:hypothetical protein
MPGFIVDDNNAKLVDPAGMRIGNGAANIVQGTTGAATAEISLSTLTFPTYQNGTRKLVRLATGTNDVLFAFGPASQAGSFTGPANMTYMPQRWVEYTTIDPAVDKSLYILQVTAAGQFHLSVLG